MSDNISLCGIWAKDAVQTCCFHNLSLSFYFSVSLSRIEVDKIHQHQKLSAWDAIFKWSISELIIQGMLFYLLPPSEKCKHFNITSFLTSWHADGHMFFHAPS